MGKIASILVAVVLAWALGALPAAGHGGVANLGTDTVVHLSQAPLSPLTGETVTMAFTVQGLDRSVRPDLPVTLRVVAVPDDNHEHDTVVHEQGFMTDANGSFRFEYSFPNAHYYDVELEYGDESVGFLVQPRAAPADGQPWKIAFGVSLLVIAGILIIQKLAKTIKPSTN